MTTKTLGAAIDALYKVQLRVDELEARLAAEKKRLAAGKEALLKRFKKAELEGSPAGRLGRVTRRERQVPTVEDWDRFFGWVRKTKSFDLLPRGVSTPAWRERVADGRVVPGVVPFTAVSLSVTSARGGRRGKA